MPEMNPLARVSKALANELLRLLAVVASSHIFFTDCEGIN